VTGQHLENISQIVLWYENSFRVDWYIIYQQHQKLFITLKVYNYGTFYRVRGLLSTSLVTRALHSP